MDVGNGVRSFEIVATKDGRRVEVSTSRGNVEVSEVTRSGREVRTARFIATRVIAVVEHPAAEEWSERPPRRRRRRDDQASLGL